MKTQLTLCLLLALGLAAFAVEARVLETGTATAVGEPTSSTTRGAITKDPKDRTGGLTVTKITVTDKFGRITRTLEKPRDYEVRGDTSTSPTIVFKPSANLSGGERVTVEMTSAKPGTLDLDIVFS